MKLVEILARDLKEWPKGRVVLIAQAVDGDLIASKDSNFSNTFYLGIHELSEDHGTASVTRAQWEAERERIAMDEKDKFSEGDSPEAIRDQHIAERARITSEVSIELASGRELDSKTKLKRKQGESDQAFRARISEDLQMAKHKAGADELERHYAQSFGTEDQALWDKVAIACYAQNVQVNREREGAAICAFDDADAFMAERAKRMKG